MFLKALGAIIGGCTAGPLGFFAGYGIGSALTNENTSNNNSSRRSDNNYYTPPSEEIHYLQSKKMIWYSFTDCTDTHIKVRCSKPAIIYLLDGQNFHRFNSKPIQKYKAVKFEKETREFDQICKLEDYNKYYLVVGNPTEEPLAYTVSIIKLG